MFTVSVWYFNFSNSKQDNKSDLILLKGPLSQMSEDDIKRAIKGLNEIKYKSEVA